ncbi:EscU/YscU/HrcU family type III secretion system export apparatus switch protein [Desulfuromonas acetoxidans]|uniref:Flagellar biosynthetic protein (FlhB)-like n=1 Tax=Desulfuromonas acetoxidans (strain DSM 684 / 11070) TaxID=281689 RepID=Q1JZP1_DESA6|nr:EscU/YscU/HrcU family type III secretion system export apparatus switch protein [Desulfuromonas acetoxidans]EAT15851.1 flagellar biosynthetic protein (FlhB)-like [Desulfuromonas acetoxidans DSM 684]MBF0644947.1 EscU/YscU/HrcU family type III secretion system export apparatus switch protein [Desulfuromonas acetoxidans]NVD25604.1 EscU/YscU/HrcU family type III secretion system export apparatus switch protein [Desulfuromonas acetoxidans]NVE17656.1 EscU/YscU/HrcU family type III secretion system
MSDDPVKKAVAVKYDKEVADAPLIVASGKGQLAENIIQAAEKAGLEISHDPDLVELLAKIPVGSEIPSELYQAVAEILAYVYRVNKSHKEQR